MAVAIADFCKRMKIPIAENKSMVHSTLVFALNSEVHDFIRDGSKGTLIESLHRSAVAKNQGNTETLSDFFSRFYNTISTLETNVFEIKTLASLLSQTVAEAKRYVAIRNLLLLIKNQEPDSKPLLSSHPLTKNETKETLKFFKLSEKEFTDWLTKNKLQLNAALTLDVLSCFLNTKIPTTFAFPQNKPTFVSRIQFRRCVLQVRCCCGIQKMLTKVSLSVKIRQFKTKGELLKKTWNSPTYFRLETFERTVEAFLEANDAMHMKQLPSFQHEFESFFRDQQKSYAQFLSCKKDAFEKEKLAPHFIQLLVIKQNSDLKKYETELETLKTKRAANSTETAPLRSLVKNFYLFELLKRESLENLKAYLPEKIEDILRPKFVKNEAFDREMMSFIKRFETLVNDKISSMAEMRANDINQALQRIKDFPIMDDLVALLKQYQDQIDVNTRFSHVLPYVNHFFSKGDPGNVAGQMKASKLLMGASKINFSTIGQGGVNVCVRCRRVMEKGKDEVIDEQAAEKMIQKDQMINKSIISYHTQKKLNVSKITIDDARRNHEKEKLERQNRPAEDEHASNENAALKPVGILADKDAVLRMNEDNVKMNEIEKSAPPPPPILPMFIGKKQAPAVQAPVSSDADIPEAPILGLPMLNIKAPQITIKTPKVDMPNGDLANALGGLKKKPVVTAPVQAAVDDSPEPPAPLLMLNLPKAAPSKVAKMENNDPGNPLLDAMKGLKKAKPTPPIVAAQAADDNIPPPPILGAVKQEDDIPPPPMIGIGIKIRTPVVKAAPVDAGPSDDVPAPILPGIGAPNLPVINLNKFASNAAPGMPVINIRAGAFATTPVKNLPPKFQVISNFDGRKMKVLLWEKLDERSIGSSIWSQLSIAITEVNLGKLLEYFEDKKIARAINTDDKSAAKIDLIGDESRKNILNISVAKLLRINKLTWEEVIKMVMEIDETKIGFDGFYVIRKLVPTKTETEIAKVNKEPMENLDLASRWICEIVVVPRFEHRFECLALSREFAENYKSSKEFIDALIESCEMLQKNPLFHKFLAVCLDVGNVLNNGTRRGNALGFKVASLIDFFTCKSPMKMSLSLMEYLIAEINIQCPGMLEFIKELNRSLKLATSKNIEDVVDEVMDSKRRFGVLQQQLESAENGPTKDLFFVVKFQDFFLENGSRVVELEEQALAARELYTATMILMGESERKLSEKKSKDFLGVFSNCFGQISNFMDKIGKAA